MDLHSDRVNRDYAPDVLRMMAKLNGTHVEILNNHIVPSLTGLTYVNWIREYNLCWTFRKNNTALRGCDLLNNRLVIVANYIPVFMKYDNSYSKLQITAWKSKLF